MDLAGSSKGRTTRRFRALAREVHLRGMACILCGQPIDYSLPDLNELTGRPDPAAKTIQHLKSVHHYPELAEVIENLASAHRGCNQQQGDREVVDFSPPATTRDW